MDWLQAAADPIVKLFDMVIERELAEERAIREEIGMRGTFWAAAEIYKLRRRVAMFEERERRQAGP
jgi:hypothetical protein